MVRTLAIAACLLLGWGASPVLAARYLRKKAGSAAALPPDERTPKDKEKPSVSLERDPEATTVRALTGHGAPDIARDETPPWVRAEAPAAEAPAQGAPEEEPSMAGSARARTIFAFTALLGIALAMAWLPEIMKSAEDGPPPQAPET